MPVTAEEDGRVDSLVDSQVTAVDSLFLEGVVIGEFSRLLPLRRENNKTRYDLIGN